MTVTPVVDPPHHATFAVIPVVDYEPPTRDLTRSRPSSPAPEPRRTPHRADRLPEPATVPLSPQMRQAAVFADAALRRVLEVIDRRRPAAALRTVLTPCLVDSVLSVSRAVATAPGAAVLRRMRVQPVEGTDAAAEVCGAYSRGPRMHAIACRVERVPTPTAVRWLVVALHIG